MSRAEVIFLDTYRRRKTKVFKVFDAETDELIGVYCGRLEFERFIHVLNDVDRVNITVAIDFLSSQELKQLRAVVDDV